MGASVSLTRLMNFCKTNMTQSNSILMSIYEQLRWFAGNQIRNVACLGGNIVTGSPISDLNPLLIAGRAVFRVISRDGGMREIAAASFFLGYRSCRLECINFLHQILSLITAIVSSIRLSMLLLNKLQPQVLETDFQKGTVRLPLSK